MRLHDRLIQRIKGLEARIAENRNANRDVVILTFDDSKGQPVDPDFARAFNYAGEPIYFYRNDDETGDEFTKRALTEFAEADSLDRTRPRIQARVIVFAPRLDPI